jgi:hypothetical protein
MRSGKSGYPTYYDDAKIKTLTITSIRTRLYGLNAEMSIHAATVQDAEDIINLLQKWVSDIIEDCQYMILLSWKAVICIIRIYILKISFC